MNPRLLLSYACERMLLPGGARMFRRLTLHPVSQQLFVQLYWFVHCKFFQEGSLPEQAHLLSTIAALYIQVSRESASLLCASEVLCLAFNQMCVITARYRAEPEKAVD